MQVPLRQVQILGGGLQIDVAEQNLDSAEIGACFEQVGSPAVTQSVWRHVLGDTGVASRFGAGVPDGLIGDRPFLAVLLRGKQIRSRSFPTPVFPECLKQGGAEWEIPTGTALPTFHANHHALAVDVMNL